MVSFVKKNGVFFLFTLSIVFLTRPYHGIRHDSILYFGQVLNSLHPDIFQKDLFFAFGSQSKFTIFPELISRLLPFLSYGELAMYGLLLSYAGFSIAVFLFARDKFKGGYFWFALVFCFLLPPNYGGNTIFSYTEAFFTARSLAEPLVVLALFFTVKDKYFFAVASLLLAFFLHPLQTLPAACLVFMYFVNTKGLLKKKQIVAACLFLTGFFLTCGPYIFDAYDAQWWSIIQRPSPHVFVSHWSWQAWSIVIADCLIVGYAAFALPFSQNTKRLYKLTLILLPCFFLSSYVLVDVSGLVYFTAAQLWRVAWLMHLFAVLSLALFGYTLMTQRSFSENKLSLSFFVFLLCVYATARQMNMAILLLPLLLFFVFFMHKEKSFSKNMKWFFMFLLCSGILLILQRYGSFYYQKYGLQNANFWWLLFVHPAVLLPIFFAVAYMYHPCRLAAAGNGLPLQILLLSGLLFYSVASWDKRDAEALAAEKPDHIVRAAFLRHIAEDKNVFWHDSLTYPWLFLKRASYWSGSQQAGLLFNRGTAIESHKREKKVDIYRLQSAFCDLLNEVSKDEACLVSEDAVQVLCSQTVTAPPDYIVLPYKYDKKTLLTWKLGSGKSEEKTFYLYSCNSFVSS